MEEQDQTLLEEVMQPYKLIVRKSPLNGYGVFASDDIYEEEVIEQAIFSMTQYRARDLIHPELRQLCYTFPCNCDTCKYRGRNFVLANGYVNLYNSSDSNETSNVKFTWDKDNRIITVIARRDIMKDEEILHYYGDSYTKDMLDKPVK